MVVVVVEVAEETVAEVAEVAVEVKSAVTGQRSPR